MVSVIIPNYNHAQYLNQRIDSILNQTFDDYEVIILDDCSMDDSKSVIEQYRGNPKISHIVYNETNSGSTFIQWKRGIDLAKGEYILIAESDDYCSNNFLDTLYNRIRRDNSVVCFCQSNLVDENDHIYGLWDDPHELYQDDWCKGGVDIINEHSSYRNIIPNASATLFRKECFGKINFNHLKRYKACGDWFTWIHILMQGKCSFCSAPLNYYRRLRDCATNKNRLNFNNIKETLWINLFLKQHGFFYDAHYWKNDWIFQANHNKKILLNNQFLTISGVLARLSFEQYLKLYKFLLK